jgi:hypothetical protein
MGALLRPWSSSIGAQVEAPKLRRVLSGLIVNYRTALDARVHAAPEATDPIVRFELIRTHYSVDWCVEMQPGGVSHTSLLAEFGV